MTDNEIIKALECCLICADVFVCETQCPFYKKCKSNEELVDYVIDIINRQQAEIESLQSEIDKQYETAEANIRAEIADGGTSCHWCEDKVRADAIKEFAELLKEYVYHTSFGTPVVDLADIDDAVKEMVGDTDD